MALMLLIARPLAAEPSPAIRCAMNQACYLAAARACRPAQYRHRQEMSTGDVSRQVFWFQHQILGPVADRCVYSVRLSAMDIRLSETFLFDMAQRGVSPAQLQDMQERFRSAQSTMGDILRIPEHHRYLRSPQEFQAQDLRAMNRAFLTKIPRAQNK